MTIERAEALKREWTDKYVTVVDGVSELRRFAGLTGRVKTVNMNCRLLIQFDTPADISWYDIAPRFLNVVNPEQQKQNADSEANDEKSATGERPTRTVAAAKTGGGNPLDQIRKLSSSTDGNAASAEAVANPLDAIRNQSSSALQKGSPARAPAVSPLEAIRQQSRGNRPAAEQQESSDVNAVESPSNPPAAVRSGAAISPLDQIRAQGRGATDAAGQPAATETELPSVADKPNAASASGTPTPLDLIRAQASAAPKATSEPDASGKTEPESGANSAVASSAESAITAGTEGRPAGRDERAGPNFTVSASSSHSTATIPKSAPTDNLAESASTAPVDVPAPSQESPRKSATTFAGSPMDQIRDQAAAESGDVSPSDSHFEQVCDQVNSDESATYTPAALIFANVDSGASGSSDTSGTSDGDADSTNAAVSDSGLSDESGGAEDERRPATQQMLFNNADAVNSSGPATSDDSLSRNATESEAALQFAGIEDPVKATYRGRKLPKKDDLKIVEGIGPKIAQLFNDDGIMTWKQLAETDPERLRKILDDAGSAFRMHNPETWPAQAKLADAGQWQELEEYQDHLDGGRESDKT